MKNPNREWFQKPPEQILAAFGEAELIKVDGRIHLRGGSMADRMEALEWLARFMPDELASVER